jgi:hypothetical protein
VEWDAKPALPENGNWARERFLNDTPEAPAALLSDKFPGK